jgi:hypothetical protein
MKKGRRGIVRHADTRKEKKQRLGVYWNHAEACVQALAIHARSAKSMVQWPSPYLYCVSSRWVMRVLLLLLLRLERGLVRRQAAANGTGLLGSEIERRVFLVLVEKAKLISLCRIDDSEDTGD